MHYSNLVIIEAPDTDIDPEDLAAYVESKVESAMGPSEENGGFWDWYQIGGRWTGLFDGYDPEADPANIVICRWCNGTGDRPDLEPPEWKEKCGGCNACNGKGKHATWPTQWAQRAGDVFPVSALTQEILDKFYRIVISGYGHFGGQEYLPWKPTGECFVAREYPPLVWIKEHFADQLAVIVDNHC